MGGKYFSVWFIAFFILVISGLFLIYRKISFADSDGGRLSVFWSALILLFLILGIIIISLFMNRASKNTSGK
jgi:thiosulfate reductase cytochrome b subunit